MRKAQYAYPHYLAVTLKETRDIVEALAKERKWSPSLAADELVKAGAQRLGIIVQQQPTQAQQ